LKVEGGSVKFDLEGNLLGFDCGLMQIEVKIGDSVQHCLMERTKERGMSKSC
jgi:hypothetical protein